MTDALVLKCIVSQNRPFNTQLVADLLATKGVKKPAAQRSLDSLAAAGKIRVKDFGKVKIYYPLRDPVLLDKEELRSKQAAISKLREDVLASKKAAHTAKKELAKLQNAMTVQELKASITNVEAQVQQLEARVKPLRAGATSISKADSDALERVFSDYMAAWQRRKRMFNDVWETMADSVGRNEADVFEEIGVDTDEAMKVSFRQFASLQSKRRR